MGLFNRYIRPGKGIRKEDVTENFGFRRFFATFGDKFWRLVTLNFLFFVTNAPVFGILAYLAGVGGTPYQAPVNVLHQPLYGVMLHGENPVLSALHGVVGIQVEQSYPSHWTYLCLAVGFLTLFTFGLSTVGLTYIQRNFIRREPVSTAEDYFGSMKRNFKQGLVLGIFDLAVVFIIAFDLVSYFYSSQSFLLLVFMYLTVILSAIYLLMRPYMYLICITFDLKLGKIIKNAWILAISGWKRNIFCGFFSVLVLLLNYITFVMIPSLGVGMVFIFTVSIAWFFQIYGAWPVIKKYMIDPFYEEKPVGAVASEESQAIFEDRG